MIMRHMQKAVIALTVLGFSMSAQAQSVDVRISSAIEPTACTPTLGGGGTIDYGTIAAGSLSATAYTVLPEKILSISISCDAPAKVALQALSGRPGSLAGAEEHAYGQGGAPVAFGGSQNPVAVGLGLHGSDKIGGYNVKVNNVFLDGVASVGMVKTIGGTTWSNAYIDSLFNHSYSNLFSFGASAADGPVAFEEMSGQVSVQAYINKTSDLDLTTPVVLDGLTTIELVYL